MIMTEDRLLFEFKGTKVLVRDYDTITLHKGEKFEAPLNFFYELADELTLNGAFLDNFLKDDTVCKLESAEEYNEIDAAVLGVIDGIKLYRSRQSGEILLTSEIGNTFVLDIELLYLIAERIPRTPEEEVPPARPELFLEEARKKSYQYAVDNTARFRGRMVNSYTIASELRKLIPGGGIYKITPFEEGNKVKINEGSGLKEFDEYYVYLTNGWAHIPKINLTPVRFYVDEYKSVGFVSGRAIKVELFEGLESDVELKDPVVEKKSVVSKIVHSMFKTSSIFKTKE